jgi:hypothetical protein
MAPLTPEQVFLRLDETLAEMEDATTVVGQWIPSSVRIWAERNGLTVRETRFAPPDRIYIVGAVPVEGIVPVEGLDLP